MENEAAAPGNKLADCNATELDALWNRAKPRQVSNNAAHCECLRKARTMSHQPDLRGAAEISLIRHCHGLAEFQQCFELQRAVWGKTELDVPLSACSLSPPKPAVKFWARLMARHEKMVGFTLAIAGYRDGTSISSFAHDGRAGTLSRPRHWPPTETIATRRRASARHRSRRMDVRSARSKERLLQFHAPGRHRAALSCRIATESRPALCTAACPRIGWSPNGGSIRRA